MTTWQDHKVATICDHHHHHHHHHYHHHPHLSVALSHNLTQEIHDKEKLRIRLEREVQRDNEWMPELGEDIPFGLHVLDIVLLLQELLGNHLHGIERLV